MVRTDTPQWKGDVSIADDPDQRVFYVTMRNLKEEDSGWYWCGVEINGAVDDGASLYLTVTPAYLGVKTESWISALRGESVTIPCVYEMRYKHHVKYWCKGFRWESCSTMVRSDSPQRKGDMSITYDPDQLVFAVTIMNVQEKDAGTYWCGVEINGAVEDSTSLHLTGRRQFLLQLVEKHRCDCRDPRKCSSAVPQKTTAKTVIETKVTTLSVKQTTESLIPADEKRTGWTSTTNYQGGLTVTVFPPVSTLSVTEDKSNTTTLQQGTWSSHTLPISVVMLGILLILLSVVMVTWILRKRHKETESSNRETDIRFTVTSTVDNEDEVTYSTLVHKKPAATSKVHKPAVDPSTEVLYSSVARQDTQSSASRADEVVYSSVITKKKKNSKDPGDGQMLDGNQFSYFVG
ncbi:CMRF35-like molecule 8 [Scleropages formosus]|uniref:CMRF35-like molecule 8 n=1 Tax=Scleropages formosus TaxID=113540 RepID=UPI0010FAC1CB|nr:CMRF35-like molecule 8 [Scleropages formosus]